MTAKTGVTHYSYGNAAMDRDCQFLHKSR